MAVSVAELLVAASHWPKEVFLTQVVDGVPDRLQVRRDPRLDHGLLGRERLIAAGKPIVPRVGQIHEVVDQGPVVDPADYPDGSSDAQADLGAGGGREAGSLP